MQISVLPRKKGGGVGINRCHTSTRDKALTAAFTVWLPLIGAKGWRGSRVHCHLAARRSWVPFPPGPASVLSQTHRLTFTRIRPALAFNFARLKDHLEDFMVCIYCMLSSLCWKPKDWQELLPVNRKPPEHLGLDSRLLHLNCKLSKRN